MATAQGDDWVGSRWELGQKLLVLGNLQDSVIDSSIRQIEFCAWNKVRHAQLTDSQRCFCRPFLFHRILLLVHGRIDENCLSPILGTRIAEATNTCITARYLTRTQPMTVTAISDIGAAKPVLQLKRSDDRGCACRSRYKYLTCPYLAQRMEPCKDYFVGAQRPCIACTVTQ